MLAPALRLLNLALRAATLFSKFALVFVLAKFLETSEVGLYGLLAATISYVLFALGFDFYTFSTRGSSLTSATAELESVHGAVSNAFASPY